MSTVVRGVQQQQCRRQDVTVGISVSAHGDHGTIDLDHRLLRPILQLVGRKEILVQHNVELLPAADRTLSPRQVSRERLQPRQHLESTRILRSHWYAYAIYRFWQSSCCTFYVFYVRTRIRTYVHVRHITSPHLARVIHTLVKKVSHH